MSDKTTQLLALINWILSIYFYSYPLSILPKNKHFYSFGREK